MARTGFVWGLALTLLGAACAGVRRSPVAADAAGYATPRLGLGLPPNARYATHDSSEDEAPGAVAFDELMRDDASTNLLDIVDGALYFTRERSLFRRRLPFGREEELRGDVERDLALAVDGDEVFFSSGDCDVSSTQQHRLGGECHARVRALFVDASSLYLVADESIAWRRSQTALFRMPRRGGTAVRIATLPDFSRPHASERILFDGAAFYYMNLFGSVNRVPKGGGSIERFLTLEIERAQALEFVDRDAIYLTSGGNLLRAPLDGSPAAVVAEGAGGRFTADVRHLYVAAGRALLAAPIAGGDFEFVTALPEAGFRPFAVGGHVVLLGYSSVLRVDPKAPRGQKLFELHDQIIAGLAANESGLFFTLVDDARSEVWFLPSTGQPTKRFEEAPLASAPAFDSHHAYFVREDGSLVRRPLDGAAAESLVPPTELAELAQKSVPGAHERLRARWTDGDNDVLPQDVVLDATHVYWLDRALGVIARIEKVGRAPEIVLADPRTLTKLLLDARFLYATHHTSHGFGVLRAPKEPGGAAEILFESPDFPADLAVTADGAIWTTLDHTQSLSGSAGFRTFSALRPENRVAALVASSETLFFARDDEDDLGQVIESRRIGEPVGRILGLGFTAPTSLLPTKDALYLVELGFSASVKSSVRRVGCCAIWRLPR